VSAPIDWKVNGAAPAVAGLTKREYMATAIAAASLGKIREGELIIPYIESAVRSADILLEELAK
jgi:hypothetical protein